MTAKQFFKSTAFKCLIALTTILLVCGIFLTVMNSLLEVTDEEKFQRAISKIYGKSVSTKTVQVENYNDKATIDEAYLVQDDGNYLVKATGKGGYSGGTVTCWVVVVVNNGSITGVDKVVIDSNVSQSYIANINDKFLSGFKTYNGEHFDAYEGMVRTGATLSATAICNAVNGAIDYVNGKFLGNVATEGQKVLDLVSKIYGEKEISVYGSDGNGGEIEITGESETVTSFIAPETVVGNSTVNSVYKVTYTEDEAPVVHYVVTSTGKGGYENGTVTCTTAVAVEGSTLKIYEVKITDNDKQSYIGKINHLDNYKGVTYSDGFEFSIADSDYKTSGASKSSTAINNALNGALKCLSEMLSGGDGNE